MADLLVVVSTIAFFAAAYGLVLLCNKMIGADADLVDAHTDTDAGDEAQGDTANVEPEAATAGVER